MASRGFQLADYDQVAALWRAAGISLSAGDDEPGLARKLERDPELFFVAEEHGAIVGVVMGCYDGRRGWINHLAVAPEQQRRGLGASLVAELENRFRAIGCAKVNLLIEPSNAGVQTFYERSGYAVDPLIFMEKWL